MATLIIFVNGKKHIVQDAEPETTLIEFLRAEGYTSCKMGCGEGGCGACTVMLSKFVNNQVVNLAVNACLYPLCALDLCAIVTAEGIGSTKDVLHPIQQALVACHASQCGFCTPGIVMSLYALQRNCPNPTAHQIEEALDGNLCRCTGYRPIVEAAKKALCPSTGKECLCEKQTENVTMVTNGPLELVGQKHALFPAELKSLSQRALHVTGKHGQWFKVLTLNELLKLRHEYPKSKIILGNSELGIDVRFKNAQYAVYIDATQVTELNKVQFNDDGVTIGLNTTISALRSILQAQVDQLPEQKTRLLKAILHMIRYFASTPIRNVATVAGNIITASPISDLNAIWSASGAIIDLVNAKQQVRKVAMKDFFLDYRKVDIQEDEIATELFIPYTKPNEYIKSYKQSTRREDDIAIVNCCIKMELEESTIKSCSITYGGMSKQIVNIKTAQEYLIGKSLSEEVFNAAVPLLLSELPLDINSIGGMPEYRRTLAISFFYKFYLYIQNQVLGNNMEEYTEYIRPPSDSTVEYEVVQKEQVGLPAPVLSAALHTTGEAKYLDDIPSQNKECHGYFVMSTEAHAKIVGIDSSAAESMPGVKAIISKKDVPGNNNFGLDEKDEELFCNDLVTCVGQPIVLVVADTVVNAKKAASLIKVKYEVLKPIITIEEAIENNSFFSPELKEETGNVEKALQDDTLTIVQGQLFIGGQEHFYIEPQGALAIPGENNEMTIYSSTQNLNLVQQLAASLLGIKSNKVVAKAKRVGGGFGGKETRSGHTCGAAVVAANKLGVPVRVVLPRDQDMAHTGTRHPFLCNYKCAATTNGKIVALDVQLFNNGGCTKDLSVAVLERAVYHADNAYCIPNMRVQGKACKTNTPSNTAFRAFGAPQAMFFMESIIDHVSKEINVSADLIREMNMYKKNSITHFGQALSDGERVEALYTKCAELSEYAKRKQSIAEFNQKSKHRKRGICLLPTKFGIGITPPVHFLNQGSALVHIYLDGSVLIAHGGLEIGQGLHIKICQIAASILQVPLDMVYISESSTDKIPNATPTVGSMGTDLYGTACKYACDELAKRLEPIRTKLGAYASWTSIVTTAYQNQISLSSQGFFKATPEINPSSGKLDPFLYFAYGAACSEVEIDTLTGDTHIIRSDMVFDVGQSTNPAVDIGQMEGAFMQGIGLYLLEEHIRGDTEHPWIKAGHLLTKGPGNYKIPTVNDLPIDFRLHIMKNMTNDKNIYSSKAIGEPPLFLACSALFAAKNAIYAARQDNHTYFTLNSPATPQRICMACNNVPQNALQDTKTHAKRVTIIASDLQLARRIRGERT